MITKEHYLEIKKKHGKYASWAIWAEQGEKPKSNIGKTIFEDLENNEELLSKLKTNVIMVGLNISRKFENDFVNFHDERSQGQDYKIRHAFTGTDKSTQFYGAYMTDIIKDFKEKISIKVSSYLKEHPEFVTENVELFKQELIDLKVKNPCIIAFGNDAYNILVKHFGSRVKKIRHYSDHISKENYRIEVMQKLPQLEMW